ncbi:MAG: hypothetical protein ABI867_38080 [Kofleriaceae bacterium]
MRSLVFLLITATAVPVLAEPDKTDTTEKKRKPKPDKDKDTSAAKKPDPPAVAPRTPGPHDKQVVALLEKIVAAADAPARTQAIAEMQKLAPEAIDAVAEWVQRTHTAELADRRKVLAAIKADVPDKSGRWVTPQRTQKQQKTADELDWQKELLALDQAMPGIGEVIADVAAIRAIGSVKSVHAVQLVFDVAFADEAMIYRDECGRYIRKLEAYAIPTLTAESLGRKEERRRYATWQLERIDRQDAVKALAAATGVEELQIAILETFRETHHREAVRAVWMYVDNDAPRVRAAARKTWMDYITGPPPPAAPRKRLQLAGGKLTKFAKPMWLTYRELADNELRKAANELLHEDYAIEEQSTDDSSVKVTGVSGPINQVEVTKRLFEYFDGERTKRDTAQWDGAKKKADAGDLVGATVMLDRLIAANPNRSQRGEMAKVYFDHAKQLEGAQKWAEASAAFSKAYGLDPKQPTLAAVHFTLGKSLEAAGKDGGADYRRAVALDPSYSQAKTAADKSASDAAGKPVWMLYAAIGAGGLALLLFGAAMMRRRA